MFSVSNCQTKKSIEQKIQGQIQILLIAQDESRTRFGDKSIFDALGNGDEEEIPQAVCDFFHV